MKNLYFILLIIVFSSCSKTKNIIPFETKQGWGFKKNNKIIIEPRYGIVGEFTDCGIAPVGDKSGNYYINKYGNKINTPIFEIDNFIDKFINGYARFKKNDKIGFINECGEVIIQSNFDYAEPFFNEISIVYNKTLRKHGAINKKGKLIIPYKFQKIENFRNKHYTKVKYNDKVYTIDVRGKLIK